ncbi:SAM-dependent methyltransferase [Streptomyces sp. NPDC058525]|uniref:SAM-dependent methyltransferase n=1 Tax=Streptomyces sp. NPDC058525 TaxID=3346538 RepID=UPI00364BA49E
MNRDNRGSSAHGNDARPQHPSGVYQALLGGKTKYPADEEVANGIIETYRQAGLDARASTWAARHFMHRSTWWLAAERGVEQFLDVGCGTPIEPNLPQIAQHAQPGARVLSVDNDPIALRYCEARLHGSPQEQTAYVYGDLTQPDSILGAPEFRKLLDLSQPVGLCLNNMLCFVPDSANPHEKVAELIDALCPGSYVTLTHPTADFQDMGDIERTYNANSDDGILRLRGRDDILRFVDGLELVEPGLTLCHRWRPDVMVPNLGDGSMPVVDSSRISDVEDSKYALVAMKP